MWVTYATYLYAACIAGWVLTCRAPREALLPVILAGLVDVPVYYFGRSSSGGLFTADVAIVAFVLRFGYSHGRRIVQRACRGGVLGIFAALAAWAAVCSGVACIEEPAVVRFAAYGVARWASFLALVWICFGQELSETGLTRLLRRLAAAMLVFGALCVAHQQGLVDLSASMSLGPRLAECAENMAAAGYGEMLFGQRMFLGACAASTASTCCVGFWAAAMLWARGGRRGRFFAAVLGLVMLWALAGTWSRSDMAGLVLSLVLAEVLFVHSLSRDTRLALGVLLVVLVGLGLLVASGEVDALRTPTLGRHAAVVGEYGPNADGTGGHRYREHAEVLRHLAEDPQVLAVGLGANGYRRLTWEGVGTMGFGHNVYLHTTCELGLAGLALLAAWLWRATRMGVPLLSPCAPAGRARQAIAAVAAALVLQRLIAGWGVDSLFAIDGMFTSNVAVVGLLGAAFSTYGPAPTRAVRAGQARGAMLPGYDSLPCAGRGGGAALMEGMNP